MFYMCLSQGICYECGPDGSQCAKVGYSAIDYYKTALSKTSSKKDPKERKLETNLKFFFNTGGTKPFCREYFLLRVIPSYFFIFKSLQRNSQYTLLKSYQRKLYLFGLTPTKCLRLIFLKLWLEYHFFCRISLLNQRKFGQSQVCRNVGSRPSKSQPPWLQRRSTAARANARVSIC